MAIYRLGGSNFVQFDDDGLIPNEYFPDLVLTDTFVVADEETMLDLEAEVGDVAVRTDLSKCFILTTTDPTVLASWQELLTPPDTVVSVDGQTGSVDLSAVYAATNDARLTDARTPTAHKTSHATGGSDALTAADIGAASSSHNHDSDYAAKSTAFVVVNHGATAGTSRPTGVGAVYWIGSVSPTNAVNGDLWYDTTGD